MDSNIPKKPPGGEQSVVLILEPELTSSPDSRQIPLLPPSINKSDRKVSLRSSAAAVPEKNNNDDDGNEVHAGTTGGEGEMDEGGYDALEKDYEKDYQTVLRLKQQMEKNEANPLRSGRKSIMSHLALPKKPKECKLLAFVIFLFAVIIVGLVVIYHFHEEELYYLYRGPNIVVNEKTLDMTLTNANGQPVLMGHLWRSRPDGKLPYDCSDLDLEGRGLCLLWKRLERLEIHPNSKENTTCFDVLWKALSPDVTQSDCFDLEDAHWFGGGISNSWPLETSSVSKRPFVSGGIHEENGFGSVLERYWLSSKGVAIVVKKNSPLHVSIDAFDPIFNRTDRQLCIYSDYDDPQYSNARNGGNTGLNYTICIGDDVQQIHSVAVSMFAKKRQGAPPPTSIFDDPVWSTWSFLKDDYTQPNLENFAAEINRNGFRHSLLMNDDGWEERYGDMAFVASRFPNPGEMLRSLHESGFKVSVWSHPQLNTDSVSFQEATAKGYLLKDVSGDVPGLTRWWNGPQSAKWSRGVAGVIGASNNATAWHGERLVQFKDSYGVDSFHFVGGDVSSLPAHPTFDGAFVDPNDYSRHIAKMASQFGNLVSVQSAYKCQHLPIMIRLGEGTSTWNHKGGLGTVIPTVLTLGLIGYPFFIPEVIGGSAYDGMPSKELYIRWLQLSAFLPIMHFSIPPYYYDNDTVALARELVELHRSLVVPEVTRVLDDAIETSTPIVRPIWWNAPNDTEALVSSTEFMVGDSILVAPVLERGARRRDVYLTKGLWVDKLRENVVHVGPKWLRRYEAPLDRVPHFVLK